MRNPLLIVCLFFCLKSHAEAREWWDRAWAYRVVLSIDTTYLDADLVDFPLSVRLTDKEFPRTLARSNGHDLRVVDAEDRLLPSDVVSWNPDAIEFNVRVPRIEAGKRPCFLSLYFGNQNAPPAPSRDIWDEHYRMVLHLQKTLEDATGRSRAPTREGYVVQNGYTAGLITGERHPWVSFNSSYEGCLVIDHKGLGDIGQGFTIAIRFRLNADGKELPGTLLSGIGHNGEDCLSVNVDERSRLQVEFMRHGEKGKSLFMEGVCQGKWHAAVFAVDTQTGRCRVSLDGVTSGQGAIPQGPLSLDGLRVGRGYLAGEKRQFGGDVASLSFSNVARSEARIRAEAFNLSEGNPLLSLGELEHESGMLPAPAPPGLLWPLNGAQSHKSAGAVLAWRPSYGAEDYLVHIYLDPKGKKKWKTLEAGTSTSLNLSPTHVPDGTTVYWTVSARSPHGESQILDLRRLTFYPWGRTTEARRAPRTLHAPVLDTAKGLDIKLGGYLSARIEKARQWLIRLPQTNPGILRMLRDRPNDVVSWAGVFPGQYLSSAQRVWRLTHDDDLEEAIGAYVRELISCQADNGYLGPFEKSMNSYLDLWGHYAMLRGLLVYYKDTGDANALKACMKIGDLVVDSFGPEGKPMPEASGANQSIVHAMTILYRETGEQRYLDFVNFIIYETWNNRSGAQFLRLGSERLDLNDFPLRRWESVHGLGALSEMYWLTGEEEYRHAFEQIWRTLVRTERHINGGFSTNEGLLGTPYNHGTIETCCTVAWLELSVDMLKLSGESRVADEIEWSTLNAALGSIPYDGSTSTYANQPDGLRQFGVLKQGPPDGPDLNCCSTNANRALGMIGDWALMRDESGFVVNFYGPSTMRGFAQQESSHRRAEYSLPR